VWADEVADDAVLTDEPLALGAPNG
jgi:hypothetical protein